MADQDVEVWKCEQCGYTYESPIKGLTSVSHECTKFKPWVPLVRQEQKEPSK